jgi:succinyl-CoA synthetase beta subunit
VHSAEQAIAAANALARPVAVKIQSRDIPHKTEAGGVILNLADNDAVGAAYERIIAAAELYAPAAHIDGVLVAPMAPPGREVILGISHDPTWGPLLIVGLGGIFAEALSDVVLALVPIDRATAHALIRRLKGGQILGPYRGQPPADTDALTDLMIRLSHFAADHADDIATIDLNPVIVHPRGEGLSIVDALIVKRAGRSTEHRNAAE